MRQKLRLSVLHMIGNQQVRLRCQCKIGDQTVKTMRDTGCGGVVVKNFVEAEQFNGKQADGDD